MTTEHDEALVERVALAMQQYYAACNGGDKLHHINESVLAAEWKRKARAVIYPPAPPKTRLQVARELFADAGAIGPLVDDGPAARAILAALALPAMDE